MYTRQLMRDDFTEPDKPADREPPVLQAIGELRSQQARLQQLVEELAARLGPVIPGGPQPPEERIKDAPRPICSALVVSINDATEQTARMRRRVEMLIGAIEL